MYITGKIKENECKICGAEGRVKFKQLCIACFKFMQYGVINISQAREI